MCVFLGLSHSDDILAQRLQFICDGRARLMYGYGLGHARENWSPLRREVQFHASCALDDYHAMAIGRTHFLSDVPYEIQERVKAAALGNAIIRCEQSYDSYFNSDPVASACKDGELADPQPTSYWMCPDGHPWRLSYDECKAHDPAVAAGISGCSASQLPDERSQFDFSLALFYPTCRNLTGSKFGDCTFECKIPEDISSIVIRAAAFSRGTVCAIAAPACNFGGN